MIVPKASHASNENSNDSPVIILVHGTKYEGLDVKMDSLWRMFLADGFPADRIFAPKYDSSKDWEGIRAELAPQILQTVRYFGPSQRYIVIGHSLGQFAALYTIAKTEDPFFNAGRDPDSSRFVSSRFDLLVGLAGIAKGWNRIDPFPEYPTINRMAINRAVKTLNSASDFALMPYIDTNPALQSFYAESNALLSRPGFRACSLYTPNDRLVRTPVEAGKLSEEWYRVPDSILPLYGFGEFFPLRTLEARVFSALTFTHLEFIRNPAVYRFMKDMCRISR